MRPDRTELTSTKGETVGVTGRSMIKVNAASALYEFAVRDLGVTAVPEHLALSGIGRGELVELLPDWHLRPLGLYAVWPNQVQRESLTTLFVRFLAGEAR